MDLMEVICEDGKWMELAQDRVQLTTGSRGEVPRERNPVQGMMTIITIITNIIITIGDFSWQLFLIGVEDCLNETFRLTVTGKPNAECMTYSFHGY